MVQQWCGEALFSLHKDSLPCHTKATKQLIHIVVSVFPDLIVTVTWHLIYMFWDRAETA